MSEKKHIQTQLEWETAMAEKVINFIRSEIYLDLPFMSISLGALTPVQQEGRKTFATDGQCLYYEAGALLERFQKNTKYLERGYLHTVLHCVFSHLWIGGQRDRDLWGLACDIAVEYAIDRMDKPCTRRPLTWLRQQTYESLEALSGISAAAVYGWLEERTPEELNRLWREYDTDDHSSWPREEQGQAKAPAETQSRWNRIARQEQLEQKRRGEERAEGEKVLAAQIAAGRNRRSYREFLKKFSVLREELHPDPDEFDLNYYTYGLRLYGDMPLLEPLESREVKKIREFAVVLDTSYSTSGELIRRFLQETFTILTENDSFFRESRIWVLQCDEQIRSVEQIHNEREIEALMNRFTVVGGGGTDFRPAFRYVNQMIEDGVIQNLSGLLYFTDGKGIYPGKRPDYQTAFLFLDEYEDGAVPPWAIRMRLTPEALGEIG